LVSLVDGKEYGVPPSGLVIGRDASATVVVAQDEVSRKHAEIAPVDGGGGGYEVRDFSSNGVFVNGGRVDGAQLLSRSDVIRVGSEEFRFYADVRQAAPSLESTMAFGVGATPPPPSAPSSKTPPVPASAVASNHPAAIAAVPTAPGPLAVAAEPPRPAAGDSRPVLAVLEIANAGPTKGQLFDVWVPLVHVGRGTHNDIVLNDDSVSETHAKLQRRDDGWYVVDVGSTNGTYVGGQRLSAERKLEGAADVRFGNVKMIFRAKGAIMEHVAGTRAIASIDRSKVRQATPVSAQVSAPVASTAPAITPTHQGLPAWVWGVVVLAIGAAVAFFLLNR
jgi:pSer/pThr/pTyr-binding forkhead associated (FHA) protein